ncbi:MAG: 30S ribosomal protein S16 [Deltaproteobacteria bacterium]|nr:30S ribosomal protein S16 [Deltaproteobacteria bacterium]
MPVRIRLSRVGTRKKPCFRVVAADRTKPRDGRFLELLGTFDPKSKEKKLNINQERFDYWVKQGAIPTGVIVQNLKKQQRIPAK